MKQRERELAKPGVIDSVKSADPALAKAVDLATKRKSRGSPGRVLRRSATACWCAT